MEELDYNITLPEFEGPLDLLLHLVKKHELDIFNIPISFITGHYLKTLDTMRALNMDVAGEYLLMAATLAHIKSKELLPREALPPDSDKGDEDEIDPRQALIMRLLEYQKYKEAAESLGHRPVVGRNVWNRGAPPLQVVAGEIDTQGPLQEVPVWNLIEALEKILSRSRVKLTHDVTLDRLSLADTINELTERLLREVSFTFESCFAWVEQADAVIQLRGQVVITFMAILEMAKLKLLCIYQAQRNGSIYIARAGTTVPPPEPEAPHDHDADNDADTEPSADDPDDIPLV